MLKKLKMIYEGVVGACAIGFTVLLAPVLRRWYSRWGASDAEFQQSLPGDEYVPHPKSQLHCAINIHAPARLVWPWFVQLGCQRAGWYSYDLLDNGGIPSAEAILPEFQHVEVGDIVKAVPNGSFGFPVARIEPGKLLVLAGTLDTATGKPANPNGPALQMYFSGDQTFSLEALDETTRLTFRMRIDWNASWTNHLIYRGILEPVSFVMSRKTLLNVKRRAERLAQKPSSF